MAVAYSGGRDSTALLHATLAVAGPLGIEVLALHVHHGLHADADAWLDHCRATCARWARSGRAVTFDAHRIVDRPASGDSVEAWARRARYAALRAMALAHGVDLVLLAHHRRDQAETFLLQALRGAGSEGLAAMPRQVVRAGVTWARPWLDMPREAIEAYARRHRLRHVDDPSNADLRFARNRLRASVWPTLAKAFPDAEASLAAAARRAGDGAHALRDWSASDAGAAVHADGELDVAAWRSLAPARRVNLLRTWLRDRLGRAAPATLVERLSDELLVTTSARWPAGGHELRLHRGMLTLEDRPSLDDSNPIGRIGDSAIDLSRIGEHAASGWHGAFVVTAADVGGVPVDLARALVLRGRRAGDRFQCGPERPARSLKLQFQSAGVPSWHRTGPIVVVGDTIVYVPGLGLDGRAVALAGAPRVSIEWRPARPRDPGDRGMRR